MIRPNGRKTVMNQGQDEMEITHVIRFTQSAFRYYHKPSVFLGRLSNDMESFATHLAAVNLLKALQNIEDPSSDVVLAETGGSGITPGSEGLEREGERLWPEGDGSRLPEGSSGCAAEERKSAEHVLRCKWMLK